uniref:Glycoside hydrolase n=1 Tax=Globisporangium ultimum (strain ATCC 200006 / CBS 805.95 / DAOM BR144) TaxID=431595 RepID=K3WLX6_GLOUD
MAIAALLSASACWMGKTEAATVAATNTSESASVAAATATTAGSSFKGTPPLVISGYRFFDSLTGKYFGIRGVNYYPRPNAGVFDANNLDFFSNDHASIRDRDFPQFTQLNANAIRLYAVDPDVDHTDFMCELQAEGIYVVVDLGSSCPGCEITPASAPECYPASYKTRGEKIIAQFSKFDNVIGFSGGNEVNHRSADKTSPNFNAPCQKMFVRDMRNYIASCPTVRQIPVGLVVADHEREDNALYYNCITEKKGVEKDPLEQAQWYGINTYIHCDDISDPKKATGFNMLRDSFGSYKYSIPVILTEFGCTSLGFPTMKNKVGVYKGQRTFHDAKWMNSIDYSEYFAGGFAFEYTTENANSKSTSKYPFTEFGPQNYGLGYLSPEDCDDVKKPCSYVQMPNFDNLAKAYQAPDSPEEPTLKTFKPAANRTAPSKCPAGYPALRDYQWEGGLKPTSKCPMNTPKFQCPKKARKATTVSDAGSTSTASGSESAENTASEGSSESASGKTDADDTKAPASAQPTTKKAAAEEESAAEESETLESNIESDPSASDESKSATETAVKASDASQVASSTAPMIAIAALVIALVQHF